MRALLTALLLLLPFAAQAQFDHEVHVAKTGSDSNPGTEALPFLTLTKARGFAMPKRDIGESTDIVVHAGTYREQVDFWRSSSSPTDPDVRIRAAAGETVVFSGSEVYTAWTLDAGAVYEHAWTFDWGDATPGAGFDPVKPIDPLGLRREVVFFNGTLLTQVLSYAALADSTYYVDEAADTLYVWFPGGVDPATGTVEVSERTRAIAIQNLTNFELTGFECEHTNSYAIDDFVDGCIQISNSDYVTVAGVHSRWNNGNGISVVNASSNLTFSDNRLNHNGHNGLSCQCDDSTFTGDESNCNNWRGAWANYWGWTAAGAKIVGSTNTVTLHLTENNQTHGLWFDGIFGSHGDNVVVDRLYSRSNRNSGLFIEHQTGPFTVKDSVILDNAETLGPGSFNSGIRDSDSDQLTVVDSVVCSNGGEGNIFRSQIRSPDLYDESSTMKGDFCPISGPTFADLDNDGTVKGSDLGVLLGQFNKDREAVVCGD